MTKFIQSHGEIIPPIARITPTHSELLYAVRHQTLLKGFTVTAVNELMELITPALCLLCHSFELEVFENAV